MVDPLLRDYNVIIVDNADKRRLWTDIILGVLVKILKVRTDLKLIVMIDSPIGIGSFLSFFGKDKVNVLSLDTGPQPRFHVEIEYLREPISDYIESCVSTALNVHSNEGAGNILVLVTDREEAQRVIKTISSRSSSKQPMSLILFDHLASEEQMDEYFQAVDLAGQRKVFVAVAAADQSQDLASRGQIVFVIDSGFTKQQWYNPKDGALAYIKQPISKSCCFRRYEIAGNYAEGKLFRLYTQHAAETLIPETPIPEISRVNMIHVILRLKALGIGNVARGFRFITPPSVASTAFSLDALYSLGALDDEGKLTKQGEWMSELPLNVMMAKAVSVSSQEGCLDQMLSIAAMVEAGGLDKILFMPKDRELRNQAINQHNLFKVSEGDYITLLNIWYSFQHNGGTKKKKWAFDHSLNYRSLDHATKIYQQLKRYISRLKVVTTYSVGADRMAEHINKCLASGFFLNAAKRISIGQAEAAETENPGPELDSNFTPAKNYYKILRSHGSDVIARSHARSVQSIKSPWVIYEQIKEGTDGKLYIEGINGIERSLLENSGYYRQGVQ